MVYCLTAPSHYPNQWWPIFSWTLRNEFWRNLNQNKIILFFIPKKGDLKMPCAKRRQFCPGLTLSIISGWCLPGCKFHVANMGPIWVLSAPDGPHVGHMNLAIRVSMADTYLVAISSTVLIFAAVSILCWLTHRICAMILEYKQFEYFLIILNLNIWIQNRIRVHYFRSLCLSKVWTAQQMLVYLLCSQYFW